VLIATEPLLNPEEELRGSSTRIDGWPIQIALLARKRMIKEL